MFLTPVLRTRTPVIAPATARMWFVLVIAVLGRAVAARLQSHVGSHRAVIALVTLGGIHAIPKLLMPVILKAERLLSAFCLFTSDRHGSPVQTLVGGKRISLLSLCFQGLSAKLSRP